MWRWYTSTQKSIIVISFENVFKNENLMSKEYSIRILSEKVNARNYEICFSTNLY